MLMSLTTFPCALQTSEEIAYKYIELVLLSKDLENAKWRKKQQPNTERKILKNNRTQAFYKWQIFPNVCKTSP